MIHALVDEEAPTKIQTNKDQEGVEVVRQGNQESTRSWKPREDSVARRE